MPSGSLMLKVPYSEIILSQAIRSLQRSQSPMNFVE
jgi:hypothetical protein